MNGAIPLIFINVLMVWTGTILLSFYFLRRIVRIRIVLTEWAVANVLFCCVIRTFVSLLCFVDRASY